MNHTLSRDERLLAAIAHGVVVLTGAGIIVGIYVWLAQKEKSAYAAAQAKQAAVYQLIGTIVTVVLWVAYTVFAVLAMLPVMRNPAQYEDTLPPLFWWSMASMLIPFAFMAVWWVYGLWGAYKCWRGESFRYAIIGRRLLVE